MKTKTLMIAILGMSLVGCANMQQNITALQNKMNPPKPQPAPVVQPVQQPQPVMIAPVREVAKPHVVSGTFISVKRHLDKDGNNVDDIVLRPDDKSDDIKLSLPDKTKQYKVKQAVFVTWQPNQPIKVDIM